MRRVQSDAGNYVFMDYSEAICALWLPHYRRLVETTGGSDSW